MVAGVVDLQVCDMDNEKERMKRKEKRTDLLKL